MPTEAPRVAFPERTDRRLRLGPFPSARDALKFLAYAAVGAVLAPALGPGVALPLVAAGFGLAVWRPDGQAVDERALSFARWRFRSVRREAVVSDGALSPLLRNGFFRVGPSRFAIVLRSGGTPVAYLPPGDLAHRFELYRELLRATEGPVALYVTSVPLRATPFVPVRSDSTGPDREARAGYGELVELLCRRRSGRRVYLAVAASVTGTEAVVSLEAEAARLIDRLAAFGLRAVRLKDRELADAGRRFGWPIPPGGP